MTDKNYFIELNDINVNDQKESKNNLDYLSWPWAWGELKKRHPDANFTVYENAEGWNYHTDGNTAWVKVGVTVMGIEHIEYLPVMNYNNKSIPLGNITSFDVNKAIQRATVKAIARHGIGLYIYAGEDLPEEEAKKKKFAGSATLYYFKEMGRKTAVDYLRETDKPMLIMQGGMDFQVLATEDFAAFRDQLEGRSNVEYRLYEDLNHLFVKGIYNDILKARKEYKGEQHIGAEVLDDIAAFIKSHRGEKS